LTSIASGPPGLEVVHQWRGFNLNDNSVRPARCRLKRITGMHSLGVSDDNREPNTGRPGETPLPSWLRSKDVVYEGAVESKTLDGLRVMQTAMRAAFRDRNAEYSMALVGSVGWTFMARCVAFDSDDEQTTGGESVWPFQRAFSIGLRLSDPRYYVAGSHVAGAASGATAVLHNAGNAATDPLIACVQDGGTVDMWSATNGQHVRFEDLPAGTLSVNFASREAFVGGTEVSGKLKVSASGWWDELVEGLVPGDNTVGVDGGDWTATWRDASE
jgi:hypothetical protein